VALLFTGGIMLAVALLLPTKDVASSASIMFLFLFLLVNLCVIKIRRNMVDELTYGYLMPFFPLFPVVAIAIQILLVAWLVHMSLIAWIVAPVWILVGIVIYLSYSKSHTVSTADEIRVLEEEEARRGTNIALWLPWRIPTTSSPWCEPRTRSVRRRMPGLTFCTWCRSPTRFR